MFANTFISRVADKPPTSRAYSSVVGGRSCSRVITSKSLERNARLISQSDHVDGRLPSKQTHCERDGRPPMSAAVELGRAAASATFPILPTIRDDGPMPYNGGSTAWRGPPAADGTRAAGERWPSARSPYSRPTRRGSAPAIHASLGLPGAATKGVIHDARILLRRRQ